MMFCFNAALLGKNKAGHLFWPLFANVKPLLTAQSMLLLRPLQNKTASFREVEEKASTFATVSMILHRKRKYPALFLRHLEAVK
jgi:hypothetical protein